MKKLTFYLLWIILAIMIGCLTVAYAMLPRNNPAQIITYKNGKVTTTTETNSENSRNNISTLKSGSKFKYVAIGDGIGMGYYATKASNDYVNQLSDMIKDKYSVNVDTTFVGTKKATAYSINNSNQLKKVYASKPDLITIELGTFEQSQNAPDIARTSEQFQSDLSTMLKGIFKNTKAKIILVSTWNRPYGQDYDTVIQRLAVKNFLSYSSIGSIYGSDNNETSPFAIAGSTTYLGSAESFYPGNDGHKAIAKTIFDSVTRLYQK